MRLKKKQRKFQVRCHFWTIEPYLHTISAGVHCCYLLIIAYKSIVHVIPVTYFIHNHRFLSQLQTRKPSCCRQTRATRKHTKNCSNSTCLQRCRWQYWSLFIRLAVGPSEICEIPRNSLKIQTYRVQGHQRSSILVPIESAYVLSY